jgi:hypothetical protein
MAWISKFGFCRRPSWEGGMVSFCTRCYMIVAQGSEWKQLESGEREHRCDPQMLEHWQAMLREAKKDRSESA